MKAYFVVNSRDDQIMIVPETAEEKARLEHWHNSVVSTCLVIPETDRFPLGYLTLCREL